jgi:hypothetical protein
MVDGSGKGSGGGFGLRVKLGEYEIELHGERGEVLETLGELPGLMVNVVRAFEVLKPKTVTTLTVKTDAAKEEVQAQKQKYPKIAATGDCDVAVLRVLETDWGKWRPRTMEELKAALEASGLRFEGRVFAGVLAGLVRRGLVRRWKTVSGVVYILAEKEAVAVEKR